MRQAIVFRLPAVSALALFVGCSAVPPIEDERQESLPAPTHTVSPISSPAPERATDEKPPVDESTEVTEKTDAEKTGAEKTGAEKTGGGFRSPRALAFRKADAEFRKAIQALRKGRRDEAHALLNASLLAMPGHASAAILKSRLLRQEGKTAEALSTTEAALSAAPQRHPLRLEKAATLLALDKPASALEQIRIVIEAEQFLARATWLYTLCQAYLKDAEKTLSSLEEARELGFRDIATLEKELEGRLAFIAKEPRAQEVVRRLRTSLEDERTLNLNLQAYANDPFSAPLPPPFPPDLESLPEERGDTPTSVSGSAAEVYKPAPVEKKDDSEPGENTKTSRRESDSESPSGPSNPN